MHVIFKDYKYSQNSKMSVQDRSNPKNFENQKLLKLLDKITMRLTQVLIMILIGVVARRSSFRKICSKEICSKCARLFIFETSPTIKKIWWVSKFVPGESIFEIIG